MYRQAPWRPKESCVKGCSLPICPFSKICLGEEMCVHTWENLEIYQIWTVNQANQHDWPKGTQKKCPIKVIETATRVRLSYSLPLSLPMSLSKHTILFFLLINTFCAPAQLLSRVQLFAILWTIACHAPLSMEFSRQEYWSGLPCTPPVDLPNPGIKPESHYVSCIGRQILYH